ncbi:hypothetical protein ACJX0J_023821, partial [Zea mays]
FKSSNLAAYKYLHYRNIFHNSIQYTYFLLGLLNNSDWKIFSYRGSRENRLLSLINEDGMWQQL